MGRQKRNKPRRVRHKDGTETIQLDADNSALIRRQLEAFREKFGHDPGPEDPLFFDPGADTPQPISPIKFEAEAVAAAEAAGVPGELIYAMQQTGRIVTEANQHLLTQEDLDEWQDAIERYQRLHGS